MNVQTQIKNQYLIRMYISPPTSVFFQWRKNVHSCIYRGASLHPLGE
jgi:hypothetical protein